MFVSWFTKMHLRIDHARHHQFTGSVDCLIRAGGNGRLDSFDQAILYQEVCFNGAAIDLRDKGIGDQQCGHDSFPEKFN